MSSRRKGISIEQIYKLRDEKIVNGYTRMKFRQNGTFPKEIIDMIFMFYYVLMTEIFKHYNSKNYHLSNGGKCATRQRSLGSSVCYGQECISSMDGGIYQWTFKLISGKTNIAIGIEETKYDNLNTGHWNHRKESVLPYKFYALWNTGYKNAWNEKISIESRPGIRDPPSFRVMDKVHMVLDLGNRTLAYQVNKEELYVAFKDIAVGDDIEYCMGIFMYLCGDGIELLRCLKL